MLAFSYYPLPVPAAAAAGIVIGLCPPPPICTPVTHARKHGICGDGDCKVNSYVFGGGGVVQA